MNLSSLFSSPRNTIEIFLGLMCVAYSAYALLSVFAARNWYKSRKPVNPNWAPSVAILKPIYGMEEGLYENFVSFCHLDYPTEKMQLIFGALEKDDKALILAERVQREYPKLDIAVVWSGEKPLEGANRKICNLAGMLPNAKYDLLVLSDSDSRVEPDYLRRIVAPFEAGVGLVTCPYKGFKAESLSSKLEALGIGADFMPSVMTSRMTEGVSYALGQTVVILREALEGLGGFEILADELADDFRLGDGTKKQGYEVILSDYVVPAMLGEENFASMWKRRLRWARTIRALRPVAYAGAIVTHGTALALLFLIVSGFSKLGFIVFFAIFSLRISVALWISAFYTKDSNISRHLPILPLSDLLSFALHIGSFCGNHVVWRGEKLRLLSGCRIKRVQGSGFRVQK